MEGLGMADAYACACETAVLLLLLLLQEWVYEREGGRGVGADECRSALSAGWMRRSGVTVALLALAYSVTQSVTHSRCVSGSRSREELRKTGVECRRSPAVAEVVAAVLQPAWRGVGRRRMIGDRTAGWGGRGDDR
eukprot:GHVU01191786.1.p3 GENE.GHVU01191786.1~~GHVU01191786.1.p3  ORF type:complete len:136 (+),score=11.64 GHVU01191786.1:518-925(+)